MKSSDHERLLESIARLTEKRDRESLELCLMQTMFELLSVEEITLYQVEGTRFGLLVRINPEGCWSADDDSNDPEYLMPINDDANDAWTVLDRFRQTVALHHFPQVGQVTISIGFTQVRDSEIPTTLIERADRALYYAKDHGRNQIWKYEDLVGAGSLNASADQAGGDVELF